MRHRLSPTFTVLVVHPRQPFRAAVRLMLEAFGHRVIEAFDAPTGLAAMDREEIEVVLVDMNAQGLATTLAIRMDSTVPIVGVARRDVPVTVHDDKGCTRLIQAPIGLEDLVDALAGAVAHRRAATEPLRSAVPGRETKI
jgi:DNA-binding NtrC family response regulator